MLCCKRLEPRDAEDGGALADGSSGAAVLTPDSPPSDAPSAHTSTAEVCLSLQLDLGSTAFPLVFVPLWPAPLVSPLALEPNNRMSAEAECPLPCLLPCNGIAPFTGLDASPDGVGCRCEADTRALGLVSLLSFDSPVPDWRADCIGELTVLCKEAERPCMTRLSCSRDCAGEWITRLLCDASDAKSCTHSQIFV